MKQHVVVTGGAGYIGSHICKALKKQGYYPVVIDNLIRGHKDFVKWGPLITGSIGNRQLLKETFEAYEPLAVIHCAAFAYVHESVTDPQLYYRNNVVESLALLEEMVSHNIDKIIFSSTCATYGQVDPLPITENQPQAPINPYGKTKLIVEQMIKDFGLTHGILRYFNAAGADLDGEIGEKHDPETHLIPLILEVALGKRPEIALFGTDFSTPDGTAIRDYVHVIDLADGHVKALKYLLDSGHSFEVNLGSGQGTSVKEMVASAKRVTGKPIPVQLSPRRKGDPSVLVANTQKAQKLLNWSPQFSNIESILSSAWAWHRNEV